MSTTKNDLGNSDITETFNIPHSDSLSSRNKALPSKQNPATVRSIHSTSKNRLTPAFRVIQDKAPIKGKVPHLRLPTPREKRLEGHVRFADLPSKIPEKGFRLLADIPKENIAEDIIKSRIAEIRRAIIKAEIKLEEATATNAPLQAQLDKFMNLFTSNSYRSQLMKWAKDENYLPEEVMANNLECYNEIETHALKENPLQDDDIISLLNEIDTLEADNTFPNLSESINYAKDNIFKLAKEKTSYSPIDAEALKRGRTLLEQNHERIRKQSIFSSLGKCLSFIFKPLADRIAPPLHFNEASFGNGLTHDIRNTSAIEFAAEVSIVEDKQPEHTTETSAPALFPAAPAFAA